MAPRSRSAVLVTLGLAASLCPGLLSRGLCAQDPPRPQQPEEPIHTLHVYMDLIQIPVLVLDSEMGRMKPVDPTKFLVSLDSGPTFHPRHVRQEGDDPITLAILLDVNGEPDVMPRISAAISALAPDSLHPSDHVTIYSLDCTLVRSLQDAPADPERLKAGVDRALESWTERRKIKHPEPCAKRVQLWDAMAFTVSELGALPGRRVLLAVTDGVDHGSTAKWNELRSFAQGKGVAIFGYAPSARNMGGRMTMMGQGSGRIGRSAPIVPTMSIDSGSAEDPFNSICQLSGGMVMSADPQFMPKQLVKFATLVRERYILEFSRARNDTPGEHGILVTINKSPTAYIRPAGVTILMPDSAVVNDPNTIPRDSTGAPEMGPRKPLKSPR